MVIVLIGIAEIMSVEDGTECGIEARVERRCGKEISNFRFEISEGSEEGLIGSAGPRLIAVVVDVGGRRRARRLLRNRGAIDPAPLRPEIRCPHDVQGTLRSPVSGDYKEGNAG